MRPLVIVTFCCAVVALALTLVPIFTGPPAAPPSDDGRDDRVLALEGKVGALQDQLVDARAELQLLRGRIEDVAGDPDPAGPEAITDEVEEIVRDAVREELREMVRRFREAGRGGGGGGDRDRRRGPPDAEELAEELDLDEAKAELVAEAYRDLGEGIRDIWRNNRGGGREENVRLMRELEGEIEARLAAELDDDELARVKERYDRMRRRGRDRDRRRDRQPPGGAEEF